MYFLAPSPTLMNQTFATWENGFSDSEIASIIALGESVALSDGTLGNDTLNPSQRQSQVSWLQQNTDTQWLYEKLAWITRNINGQFFDFNLSGFAEAMQYTVYTNNNDHYDWHLDSGEGNTVPRKLSLTVQLSDPSEYEGGDLQLQVSKDPTIMQRTKGLVVAFPSYTLHRVTPVTAGTRRSLVVWVGGPKFT